MRILIAPGFISLVFILHSCSKNNQAVSNNTIDTNPLPNTVSKIDTLKIMAYNVLNFGNGCQGTLTNLDSYFKTIIQYTQPDIISCEKINAFNPTPGSFGNLADELLNNGLNGAFPNQYAYALPSNNSRGSNMAVLFYNKQKLTYVKTQTLVANITDFNFYKLYYNDVNLSTTGDTTFLYVVVNHTQSGSSSSVRDQQVSSEMTMLRNKFSYFPNLINMGDFNTAGSYESGYQSVVNATDSTTILYDPPYYPDKQLLYPGNWDVTPYLVAPYLTTSTRSSASIPNTCGTSGGAKSWFDHIFISPWLVTGANYMQYIPNSYQTIGNDGNRLGVDINSTTPATNNSAPSSVINALFQFSNKYPVMLKLLVKANRNRVSPTDPVEKN
ncbi:MAG: hypothetical protein C0459_14405 [Chitinophaga sp.]|jgi:hypothetical protein|nr:hypothetical protein [Chitinophaga sp.]